MMKAIAKYCKFAYPFRWYANLLVNFHVGTSILACVLITAGTAALALPCVTALVYAVKYAVVGKRKLEEDVLPRWRDNAEEALRVQGRRRWEKKHGKGSHEK